MRQLEVKDMVENDIIKPKEWQDLVPEGERHFRDIKIRDMMREVFLFLHRKSDMESETISDKMLYNFLYMIYGKELKI